MKAITVAGVATIVVLAGCSSPQQTVSSGAASIAASATVSGVSAAAVDRLVSLCKWVGPMADIAAISPNAATKIVGEFGSAYCDKLDSGVVPATTDANTENWLTGLLGDLREKVAS